MPKIRFILVVWTSARDANGNTYTYATVRSTLTGRALKFHAHSASNARVEIREASGLDWDAIALIEVDNIPKRQWSVGAKGATYDTPTSETLAELEKE